MWVNTKDYMFFPFNFFKRCSVADFPGGTVDKNPPQCRGHRFDPWSKKISHAMEQLRSCATITEPAR